MSRSLVSVFGNVVRLKLITCLSDDSKSVSDLISSCGLSQSAVSQHLMKLKEVGIVEASRQGKNIVYSLRKTEFGDIAKKLLSL